MRRTRLPVVVMLVAAMLVAPLPFGARQAAGATIAVTNTADSGPGSLRGAINFADDVSGTTITFAIDGSAPYTIHLLTALPAITLPTVIDGTTQSEFDGCDSGPVIELDGSGITGVARDGLVITGGGSTIRGLVINGFASPGRAIFIDTRGGNRI